MYNSPYFKTHIFCNLLPIKNHLIKPVYRDHREDHKFGRYRKEAISRRHTCKENAFTGYTLQKLLHT